VIELLGQTILLAWPEKNGPACAEGEVLHVERPALPPLFIERANCSCSLRAMNEVLPNFDLQSLLQLSAKIPIIVLVIVSDMAGANVRMKGWIQKVIVAHNSEESNAHGFILFLDVGCLGHIFVGFLSRQFAFPKLIPRHTDSL